MFPLELISVCFELEMLGLVKQLPARTFLSVVRSSSIRTLPLKKVSSASSRTYMGKSLVIVESPAEGENYQQVPRKDFVVKARWAT
jgi:hypothetical protein